jgi:hypothetical protein
MISEIEQSTLDIDWFFTDNNKIGFVASAGGRLPKSVAKSKDNIELLSNYFRGLSPTTDIKVNPKLKEFMPHRDINENYLSDFIYMAERGLYSFDKISLNNFNDDGYYLVASPVVGLTINDLPIEISNIIAQTISAIEINELFYSSSFL